MLVENTLRRTLLSLYTQYLEDPRSERIRSALRELAKDQEGLMAYAEHASEPPVSSDVLRALNNIDLMIQYGSYPRDHPLADDKLLRTARDIRAALEQRLGAVVHRVVGECDRIFSIADREHRSR